MNTSTIFVESNSQLMDIQTKKLKLIKDFLQITDENLLDKLEEMIQRELPTSASNQIQPMSLNDFHAMVNESIGDYNNGNIISQDQLEKEVIEWK